MGFHGTRDMAFFGRGIRDLPEKCHGIRDMKNPRERDKVQNVYEIREMVYFHVGMRY